MRLIHFVQKANLRQIGQKLFILQMPFFAQNRVILTNLFVKSANTHDLLDPTSCQPYNCKKDLPCS